jgi:hypothetical protein
MRQMTRLNSWKIQMLIVATTVMYYDLPWATEARTAVMPKPEGYKAVEKPETRSGRM